MTEAEKQKDTELSNEDIKQIIAIKEAKISFREAYNNGGKE